jgi:hypothetical protein
MKKPVLIFLALVALAATAYFACYHFATRDTRAMLGSADDMAWLRAEFALNDEQARAIAVLKADYEPRCMEMCERITKSSARLEKLLAESKVMTPELEAAVREASQTQADCHAATLAQAFAISAHMPPEHAARYRAMIAGRILPDALRHDTATHH